MREQTKRQDAIDGRIDTSMTALDAAQLAAAWPLTAAFLG